MIVIETFERRYQPRAPPSNISVSGSPASWSGTAYRCSSPLRPRSGERSSPPQSRAKADSAPPHSDRPLPGSRIAGH